MSFQNRFYHRILFRICLCWGSSSMIKFWGCIVSAELLAGLQKKHHVVCGDTTIRGSGGHGWWFLVFDDLMVHFVNHKMTHTQMYQTQKLIGLKEFTRWAAPNDFWTIDDATSGHLLTLYRSHRVSRIQKSMQSIASMITSGDFKNRLCRSVAVAEYTQISERERERKRERERWL